MLHRCRLILSLVLPMAALAGAARAQQNLLEQLLKLVPAAQGQADDSEPMKKLDAAVAQLIDPSTKLTSPQYHQAAKYLMHGQMPARAGRIVNRGLELSRNNPELLEFLGMTEFSQCQTVRTDANMRSHARKANAAFQRARDAGAKTPTCRLLPWQAYIVDCRFDQALAAIDVLIADKKLQRMMPDRHLARGMALLGVGQYKEALAELTHNEMQMQTRMGSESMAARAEAMAGLKDAAIKRSKATFERRKDAMALGLYADALAFAGKHDKALKVLKNNPVIALKGEPAMRVAQRKQSRATFEYLISLRGKAPKNLQVELAQRLGHAVKMVGADGDSLAESPLLLGNTARSAPSGPKGWGNDLLILACVVAGEDYKPGALENTLVAAMLDDQSRKALRGAGAKARALQILHAVCMRDDYEGSLVALQIGQQL